VDLSSPSLFYLFDLVAIFVFDPSYINVTDENADTDAADTDTDTDTDTDAL
jgi:hypothetical protein